MFPLLSLPVHSFTWFTVLVLVLVSDRKLLRRKQRDDLRAVRREHDFFFDARRRNAVRRGTERFNREDHARLELVRILERVEPRDERPLVQAQSEAMTEVEPER